MGVCRRIYKYYEPSELTICVTIRCEPNTPPRFDHWRISKPGCPPKIIPCSTESITDENREKKSRRKAAKGRRNRDVVQLPVKLEDSEIFDHIEGHSEHPLLHSISASLISDYVETFTDIAENNDALENGPLEVITDAESNNLKSRECHVSVTSLDSIAGLGWLTPLADDTSEVIASSILEEKINDYDAKEKSEENDIRSDFVPQRPKGEKYDLLANGDTTIPTIELLRNDGETQKTKALVRKKKSTKHSDAPPRYRDFTETSIYIYVEMKKENIGEFVWDHHCTRIDALVAPILELDRTTTPEVPAEIEIFD